MKNTEFYIDHDGIPLHAKLDFPDLSSPSGRYPLVIVIHGFTGHMEETHIRAVAHALNENGFASLRVEMYGHGASGGSFREHTLFKWLSGSLTVIDYARNLDFVTDLYLAGHSQGGLTAMLAGAMKEDVLKAIIPLSPAVTIPDGARQGLLLGNPFDPLHVPEFIRLADGRELGGNYARAAQLIYVEPAIRKFKKPVLVIHGDADESIPVDDAVRAAKLYDNVTIKIIPGDTHCYDYHLDQVLEAVKEWMLAR